MFEAGDSNAALLAAYARLEELPSRDEVQMLGRLIEHALGELRDRGVEPPSPPPAEAAKERLIARLIEDEDSDHMIEAVNRYWT